MPRTHGFTLLELLLVVAIIGILGAVGFSTFGNAANVARVNEASAQLAADFQRARSSAQRSNRSATLTFPATTATSYTLNLNGQTLARTLPEGIRVTLRAGTPKTVTYKAPFGETTLATTVAAHYTLASERDASLKRYLKIIGLTGKVYSSAYE